MPEKVVGYFGVRDGVFGGLTSPDVVKEFVSLKSFGYTANITEQSLYGDNRKMFAAVNDQGGEISLGLNARPEEYEEELGFSKKIDGATAQLKQYNSPKHAIGFVYDEALENGSTRAVKVWVLGVQMRKAAQNFSTNTESLTFGEYIMPGSVTPVDIAPASGEGVALDKNGNKICGCIFTRAFGEEGFETFHETVYVPKLLPEGGEG